MHTPCLERAREWLVFAGQLEQAVFDAGGWPGVAAATNQAAAVFLTLREGQAAHAAREQLLASITCAQAHLADDQQSFRLPEGFAWYALYPDAYARTAQRWAKVNPGRPVTIIGLRSIGTSLSAVVAEQLRRIGHPVAGRVTLRPGGHPFRRNAELPHQLNTRQAFIIVDEGPGLSGSSMAGTAAALHERGVEQKDIIFFPAHGNGPGTEAGAAQRQWWREERCWFSAADALRPSLAQPACHVFAGYAAPDSTLKTMADIKSERQMRLAEEGFALPCIAKENGWIAVEDAGMPLTLADRNADFIHHLANYIRRAGIPADFTSTDEGAIRIAEAIIAYATEKLPNLDPDRILEMKKRACNEMDGRFLHGDGRLAPSEWVRMDDGRILKRNATGTATDHGWPGAQSALWDVAGAAVEWCLPEEDVAILLERTGIRAGQDAFAFHRAGYCCAELARAHHCGNGQRAARHEADLIASLRRLQ